MVELGEGGAVIDGALDQVEGGRGYAVEFRRAEGAGHAIDAMGDGLIEREVEGSG